MKRKHQPPPGDAYDEWLGGLTLTAKIKTLETGRLVQCLLCDRVFFDAESVEDRQLFPCKQRWGHDCVDYGRRYMVLKRGFRGPCWVVFYVESKGAQKAIQNFFMNKNTTRPTDIGPNGGL